MPTTAEGIKPDIIVNPHAMPSRMTIGHLVECITSKVGVNLGAFGDCTAFTNKGSKHKELGNALTKFGYHSSGCELLYNGMTGEQLETEIYFGPTFYLRLKHMPKDKVNYRARGPRTVLTRQTVQGRANDGGLRIGEMDRDCLIAHGMSAFIKESMMVRGDQYEMAICNKTGCVAVYNEKKNIFLSPMADGPLKFVSNVDDNMNIINVSKYGRDFSVVKIPYAFKLLMQELQAMNCQMRVITEDNVDQLMSLTNGDDIKLIGFNNLDEVAEKTKDRDFEARQLRSSGMRESAAIDYEKLMEHTPSPESIANEQSYFQDERTLYNMDYDDGEFGNVAPNEMQQGFNKMNETRKNSYRFNAGDIVVFEPDMPQYKYRIIEFEPEEMKYITQAIEGPHEGKYRDSFYDDELMTPPVRSQPFDPDSPQFNPESPPTGPKTPSYSPGNPDPRLKNVEQMPSPEVSNPGPSPEPRNYDELEEEEFSDEEGGLAPVSMSPITPSPDNETAPQKQEEELNEKGEKILNRISSLDNNPADNKGLEKLSTIEDEAKDGDDEDEDGNSSDKKKII